MKPTQLIRLGPADADRLLGLTDADPVCGALVRSLLFRFGLAGPIEYHGMALEELVGVVTLDDQGRSTILGGDPEWAGSIAEWGREVLAANRRLAFIDAPEDIAIPLARLLPPRATEELGIWAWRKDAAPTPPAERSRPGGFELRELAPGDGPGLQALYDADLYLGKIQAANVVSAAAAGHRLVIVGLFGGEIAAAAWGSLTEPGASRVSGVMTHPRHRGRGFASAVVGDLTGRLVDLGKRPFLYVSLHNPPAMSTYERLGYKPYARINKLHYEETQE